MEENNEDIDPPKLSSWALEALKEHLQSASPTIIDKNDKNDNKQFKSKEYWNERFETEDEYDWLLTFIDIWPHLSPHIPFKESRVLVIGCGNSRFSFDLFDRGFEDITNIDYSERVIEKMRVSTDALSRPKMTWKVQDMTAMSLEDFGGEWFDVVVDKAAMDALVVDEEDVWHPQRSVVDVVDRMCLSVRRVLHPSRGKYIQVTFAQPHFRSKYLMGSRVSSGTDDPSDPLAVPTGFCERYQWTVASPTIIEKEAGCLHCFMYVASVGPSPGIS